MFAILKSMRCLMESHWSCWRKSTWTAGLRTGNDTGKEVLWYLELGDVFLSNPSTSSSLWITDSFFQHASPRLWNQLPASLRQPRTDLSNSDTPNPMTGTSSIGFIDSQLSSSISPGLKPSFSASPSHHSLPFLLQDWLHGFPGLFTDSS